MKLLFIGDIVGPEATAYLAARLPQLRRTHAVDLVVANAENCSITGPHPDSGFGMRADAVEALFGAGVDVITSGNHAWDAPDAKAVLAHPRVLRPYNLPANAWGKGLVTIDVNGELVSVLNLADTLAIPTATPLYDAWGAAQPRGTVVVDLHGTSSITKQAFAHAIDGEAAAVLGTHTHEPTLLLHLLPGGTALVCDVGMTGRLGGVAGIEAQTFVASIKNADELLPFRAATGPMILGAVLLQIEGNRTTAIQRLYAEAEQG
jgi:2',3'-cyclic-nucleotide 2'-phosphodiesterase